MSLAATVEIEIVLMATVRSILGSRARNTAPIAPRPSSARISYRPSWCIVSIMHISPLGGIRNTTRSGDGADNSTENQRFSQPRWTVGVLSVGRERTDLRAARWVADLRLIPRRPQIQRQAQHIMHARDCSQSHGGINAPAFSQSRPICKIDLVDQRQRHTQNLDGRIGLAKPTGTKDPDRKSV